MESQLCADVGDYRGFCEALKAVYGPTHQVQSPLRSSDGQNLFTDNTSILACWSEHFQTLFSANRAVQVTAINRVPQLSPIEALDEPPTLEELTVDQLKSHKAAGVDGIPPEIWKQGGITVLSIAGKVLARVLLKRLVPTIAEDILPESQCGFRANRGTTDMVFVLHQLQEKCREQNMGLYATFIDLTKAFDTVSRTGLWLILERLGCPPKFLQMVMQLHENQRGQPTPCEEYRPPHISIGDTELKSTQQFTYLGCTISSDAKIDKEIDNRLAKANSSFGRLYQRVWNNKCLKCKTKIRVYRAVVLTTLLFSSETWVIYRSHIHLLERFHQHCRRTILNIHWSDLITNVEVLEQAEVPSIEAIILKYQLRWAGHVSRLEDHRLPNIVMFGELSSGHRDRGAPKKRFKVNLKKSLTACNIDHRQWSNLAADHVAWRHTTHQAAAQFQLDRKNALKDKRQRRKACAASTTTPNLSFPCSHCSRPQISRIGLVSHERASSRRQRGQTS
ncbi:uncharacterized protein [Acropora muricata]|uniref:uncharacterized protein n=1 Tax=Acropora muricata TaxID=159855 RepID=UPI0034E48BC1